MPPLEPPRALTAEPVAYANHFAVGFNAFEFLLDFGQAYDSAEGMAVAHTRIVTSPAYAKAFRALIDRSIAEYEAAFGTISLLPPDEP